MSFSAVLAVDLETTGFSPKTAEVIEVGVALWLPAQDVTYEAAMLLQPRKAIPPHITEITGISAATLAAEGTGRLEDVVAMLRAFARCPGVLFVAHNGLAFDAPFLQRLGVRVPPNRWYDTMLQARAEYLKRTAKPWRKAQQEAQKRRTKDKINLGAMLKAYNLSGFKANHRAGNDALAALALFKKQLKRSKVRLEIEVNRNK